MFSSVPNGGLDPCEQLRGYFSDAMLLGMLGGLLEDFVLRLAAHDVGAPAGRIYLGAFQNLSHHDSSSRFEARDAGCRPPVRGTAPRARGPRPGTPRRT